MARVVDTHGSKAVVLDGHGTVIRPGESANPVRLFPSVWRPKFCAHATPSFTMRGVQGYTCEGCKLLSIILWSSYLIFKFTSYALEEVRTTTALLNYSCRRNSYHYTRYRSNITLCHILAADQVHVNRRRCLTVPQCLTL